MRISQVIRPAFPVSLAAALLFQFACGGGSGNPGGGTTTPPPPIQTVEMVFSETISGVAESDRLNQEFPASDFAPTGLYLPPNATLALNVEQQAGTRLPVLLIGTYSRYRAKNNPQSIQLTAGSNRVVADPYGGLLYIRYASATPAANRVKITFQSGFKKAPYFILGTTTESDWDTQLATLTEAPDVVLESTRAIQVMSRTKALEYQAQSQGDILRSADQIIDLEADISGLDGSAPEHQRERLKYLMTETDNTDYYMFATWYRTAYVYTTGAVYAFSNKLGSSEAWGPWHELGHMHQQRWSWSACTEVTVNIYSLAVEKGLGYTPNRLVRDNAWAKMDAYFNLPTRDFNSSQVDVWGRLCMFRQLNLAFGDDFYRNLHKQARLDKPNVSSSDTAGRMRYFMLTACKVSGRNLSDFFAKWGLPVPQAVYDEISALNLPAPLVDPSTLRDQ